MLHIGTLKSNGLNLNLTSTTFQSVIFGKSFHSLSLNFFICNTIKIIAPTSQVSMRIKQESIHEELRTIPEIKLAYKS